MFILAITPGQGFDAARWRTVLESGVDGFLIREPRMEAKALLEAARWCRAVAPQVELRVRERLDVALAAGCGVHAPEGYPEIPDGLLPVSRPLHAETQLPSRIGARQLLVSPIFETPGKGPAWGAARLHRFLDTVPPGPRVLALGGVTAGNADTLRHPRLDGVAMIRGLFEADSPEAVVVALRTSASR